MAHRINQADIDRQARSEDERVLASWQRLTRERRNLTQNLPVSSRQARDRTG